MCQNGGGRPARRSNLQCAKRGGPTRPVEVPECAAACNMCEVKVRRWVMWTSCSGACLVLNGGGASSATCLGDRYNGATHWRGKDGLPNLNYHASCRCIAWCPARRRMLHTGACFVEKADGAPSPTGSQAVRCHFLSVHCPSLQGELLIRTAARAPPRASPMCVRWWRWAEWHASGTPQPPSPRRPWGGCWAAETAP